MINLSDFKTEFEIKIGDEIKRFDPYEIGWALREPGESGDPIIIRDAVNRITGLQLDCVQTNAFMRALDRATSDANEKLKKAFGPPLSSVTTTDSPSEKSPS